METLDNGFNAAFQFHPADQRLLDMRGYNPVAAFDESTTELMGAQFQMYEKQRSWLESAGYLLPGVLLSAIDTFAESFGLIDDATMENALKEKFPDFGDYFSDNRAVLGAVGDIGGAFVPGMLAVKAVRTTGVIGKLATRVFGDKAAPFLSTGQTNAKLFEEAYQRSRVLASKPQVRNLAIDQEFIRQNRKLIGRSVADTLIENVAADAAIAATMHSSDFLFPDEMSLMDHALFFGGTNAIFGVAALAHANFVLKRGIQQAAGSVTKDATNPGKIPFVDIQAQISGDRHAALTWLAHYREDIAEQATAVRQAQDELSVSATQSADSATAQRMKDVIVKIGSDSPHTDITRSYDMSADGPAVNTIREVLRNDPSAASGATSFEDFATRSAASVNIAIDTRMAELKATLSDISAEMTALTKQNERGSRKFTKLRQQASKTQAELATVSQLTTTLFEIDGSTSVTRTRAAIFQDGERKIAQLPDKQALIRVSGHEVTISETGAVEIPITHIPEGLTQRNPALEAIKYSQPDVNKSLNVRNANELRQKLRGVLASLPVTPEVKAFQSQIKEPSFVGYVIDEFDSLASMTPTDNFRIPVTIAREQAYGLDAKGRLLFQPRGRQSMDGGAFIALDHEAKTAVWDGLQSHIDRVTPETFPVGLSVRSSDHFTKLDYLEELAAKFGDERLARELSDSIDSVDDIRYLSLSKKFDAYQQLRNMADEAHLRGEERHIYGNLDNVARALNLPRDNHPLLTFFESQRVDGITVKLESLAKNMEELRVRLRQYVDPLESDGPFVGTTTGTMLQMARNRKPILGVMRMDMVSMGADRSDLLQYTMRQRATVMEKLKQSTRTGARLVPAIATMAEQQPAIIKAAKDGIQKLVHGTLLGSKLTSGFVTQAFRLREMPGARAIDQATDLLQKVGEKQMEHLLQSPNSMTRSRANPAGLSHQQVINRLIDGNHRADLLSFSVARNAMGAGWELAEAVPYTADGKTVYQFELKDSVTNRRIWREMFGTDMPAIDKNNKVFMPITGRPVTYGATETAFHAISTVDEISQALLAESNALRVAKGLRPMQHKRWHMPARVLESKELVYLLDSAQNVKTVVGGATPKQALARAQKEIDEAKRNGVFLTKVNQQDIARYYDAKLEAFFDMKDFSRPWAQTGPSKGKSFGEVTETGPLAVQSMMESLLRGFSDVTREARLTLFEPELNYLNLQNAAAGFANRSDSVFSLVANRLVGTQNLAADSIIGRTLLAVETNYDKAMTAIWDAMASARGVATTAAQRATGGDPQAYRELKEALPSTHQPFNDMMDYLNRTDVARIPPELRRHAAGSNEITTAVTIRMFDVGMGLVNILSLATTLPPVLKMLERRTGESVAEHLERISGFGATTPGGVPYVSPTRAIIEGMQFFFSEEGRRVAAEARKRGFFDQFAAEQVDIYGRTGQQFVTSHLRSLADKTSVVTDKTERLARSLSFMTFYQMGKKGLGLEDNAAMAFAHAQANNTIADFRPSNRPVIFQGAAGMPLGLFTTFMWNFLQRMFNIVETGSKGAAAYQFGLQASLFGAESLPGVEGYMNVFTSNYDGSLSPVDRLREGFGDTFTDVFLNGSVSTLLSRGITSLLPGDSPSGGISIGPRAGVGLPFESGIGTQSIAAFRLAERAWRTSLEIFDSVVQERGLNSTQAAQILAASNINKGLSNVLELASGQATDLSNNLIEEDTRTRVGIAARTIGFKPLFSNELRQENRRHRGILRAQSELKERLRENLIAKARSGSLQSDDVEEALADYMRAGGRPDTFKRFFVSQMTRGVTNKLDLDLAEALRNSADQNRIARLLTLSDEGF